MNAITDIRQSNEWSSYLTSYKWKTIKIAENITVRTYRLLGLNIANIQRPNVLREGELQEIDAFCVRNKIFYIKISPDADQDMKIFKKFGYKETKKIELPSKTSIIELKKPNKQIWNNISSKCRYNIRKAERDGEYVEFIRNPNLEQIANFHDTLLNRSRKKGFSVQNRKQLENRINAFGENAFIGNVFSNRNKLLGSKLFLGSGKGVWGIYAATTEEGQKTCAGYKLLWESIAYFKKIGYEMMDLEGLYDERVKEASEKWKGYTFFKKQFNGREVLFPLPQTKFFNIFKKV